MSIDDKPRSGRSSTARADTNVEKILEITKSSWEIDNESRRSWEIG